MAEDGCCRGVLTVGNCTVEAINGHLLGLAAWMLNAGAVSIEVSRRPGHSWRVKSNAIFSDAEIERLRFGKTPAERDEGLFVVRFSTALYHAHNAARAHESAMDTWTTESLPQVLALVPKDYQVNTKFPRAAEYDSRGLPRLAPRGVSGHHLGATA